MIDVELPFPFFMSKAVQKYEEETPAHSPETVVALVQHQLFTILSNKRSKHVTGEIVRETLSTMTTSVP